MKKALLVIGLIVGSIGFSVAQSVPKIGIQAGVNFSNISSSGNGAASSSSNITGFHAGIFADCGLSDKLSIEPGVFYTTKGGSEEFSTSTTSGTPIYTIHFTENTTFNYIEVPVNVLYHIPASIGKIYLGGGPYIATGISGKDNASITVTGGGTTQNSSQSQNITFGNNSTDVKNPDYGINIVAGLKLQRGLSFGVNYGMGLANLSNNSATTTKNKIFSVSVGFDIL